MLLKPLKSVLHHIRYFPLWSALTVLQWRAFDLRSRGLGTTFGIIMRWFPQQDVGLTVKPNGFFPI